MGTESKMLWHQDKSQKQAKVLELKAYEKQFK